MMLPTRKISNLAILLHEIDLTSLQKSFHLNSGQHGERNCATDILLVTVKLSLVHSTLCLLVSIQPNVHFHISHFRFIFNILSNYTARNHGLEDCVPVIMS